MTDQPPAAPAGPWPPYGSGGYPPQDQGGYPPQDQGGYPPQDQGGYPPQDYYQGPDGYQPLGYHPGPDGYQAGYAGYPPQAGSAAANWPGQTRSTEKNFLGIVSLVASVAGIVLLPVIGSIAGIVFGHLGLKAVTNHTADNRGLALAGLIVGYVGLALMVLIIVVVMWLAATVMGGLGGSLYYGAGPLLVA